MEDIVRVLTEKRNTLRTQLSAIETALKALGNEAGHGRALTKAGLRPKNGRKGKLMSEATKAKLRKAAKARWAKLKKAA